MSIAAGTLDTRVTFQRDVGGGGFKGAGTEDWQTIVTVWAAVEDVLPSRAERLVEGVNIAARPTRIRVRARDDLGGAKRILIGTRVLHIVAGPAFVRQLHATEFMAEEQSTGGRG